MLGDPWQMAPFPASNKLISGLIFRAETKGYFFAGRRFRKGVRVPIGVPESGSEKGVFWKRGLSEKSVF